MATPTIDSDVLGVVESSWKSIRDGTNMGYIQAKVSGEIGEHLSPILFFYDTLFDIVATKPIGASLRNNVKHKFTEKENSLLSITSVVTNVTNTSLDEWTELIQYHRSMGVCRSDYFSIGASFIETIMIMLNENDMNDEVVKCWRLTLSYVIDRLSRDRGTTPSISYNVSSKKSICHSKKTVP
jgi:hemoglobin-like flavoprotein